MTATSTKRRVVAITGGGSGLGRALALAFAAARWDVALCDINEVGAASTAEQVQRLGVQATWRCVDVTDAEAVEAWASEVYARWGGCDALINNAGVAAIGSTGEVSLEDWRWCIDVDLFGVIHGCHSFVPRMKEQRRGHIVNIASIAAYALAGMMGPYNVAKAGVVALSETLRAELEPHDVAVTVVCPGFFRTHLGNTMRGPGGRLVERARRLVDEAPLSAESVAGSVLRAVEERRPYVVEPQEARAIFWLRRLLPAGATAIIQRLGGRRGATS